MNTWKLIQVGGVTILVCAICYQSRESLGPGESHSHNEAQSGPGYAMGHDAIEMAMGAGPSSGPPPMGNRAINHRILASWEAHQSYDNMEMILRRQRFRVPA